MKKLFAASFLASALFCASAQQVMMQGGGPGQGAGMMQMNAKNTTIGTITAISGDSLTVKTVWGKTVTVKTNAETRFNTTGGGMMMTRQQGGPNGQTTTTTSGTPAPAAPPVENGKISDFKVGDPVIVRGDVEGDSIANAKGVMKGNQMMVDMLERQAAEMGKTIVAGEIKSIDETKLTINRVDGVTSTIEVDENTSFMRGRENITLADFKVGDNIMAQGEVKNGTFMVKSLRTGGAMRRMEGAPAQTPPASH